MAPAVADAESLGGQRIVGHQGLADYMGWTSAAVSRNLSSKSQRRREAGTTRPGDLPPPDGQEVIGSPRRRLPYWHEETIRAWQAGRPAVVRAARTLPDGLKACSKCGQAKPLGDYYSYADKRHPDRPRRLGAQCKACHTSAAQAWNDRNPGRAAASDAAWKRRTKRRYRARLYGLSEVELLTLEAAQQGHCAICGEFIDAGLCIDHDHKVGHVRGLLCNLCNLGLGAFGDDPRRLVRAAIYLKVRRRGLFDEPTGTSVGRLH